MAQFDMVDPPQGPDPKRLLLAVVMTSAVLLVYSYFFSPTMEAPVAQVEKKQVEKKNESLDLKATKANTIKNVHAQATDPKLSLVKKSFENHDREEDQQTQRAAYRAEISNQGALIDRFSLLDFSQPQVLFDRDKLGSYLMAVSSKNHHVSLKENEPYEILNSSMDSITLRHVTKEGLLIKRHYRFLDHATVKEEISWKNLSIMPLKVEMLLSARMVHEEVVESGFLNPGVSGQSIAVRASGKHEKFSYKDAEEKSKSFSDVKYAAFDDQFFLSAIVPEYSDEIDRLTIAVRENDDKKLASIDIMLKPFVLINGEERSITHQFFIGPKQIDLLASFSTPLDENIDFGWFGVLSRPMLWLLVQIYGFAKNYGLAIILITFIIKLLTYPLTHKSMSSQQEMKKLQPKLKELQQKYAHDRTLLGQKQMELYRSHGVNPVAGCLPLLIQLPIWFAFFQMLRNSVELFDQPFYGWITDLTRPDQYFVLPILMGVSMLVQQAFTPTPTDQPHMKYVMMGMPVFLTFIMLNMPAGLSLYILTNNLLTIIQQTILKKYSEKTSV